MLKKLADNQRGLDKQDEWQNTEACMAQEVVLQMWSTCPFTLYLGHGNRFPEQAELLESVILN